MGTVVRRNERSWAIEIISQINGMLKRLNIRIRKAGGESTLSVNKKVCSLMCFCTLMRHR